MLMWCSINIIISVEKSQVFVSCFAQFCGNDTCHIYSSSKNIYLYKCKTFILLLYHYYQLNASLVNKGCIINKKNKNVLITNFGMVVYFTGTSKQVLINKCLKMHQ